MLEPWSMPGRRPSIAQKGRFRRRGNGEANRVAGRTSCPQMSTPSPQQQAAGTSTDRLVATNSRPSGIHVRAVRMLPTSAARFRQPLGPRAPSAAPFQLPPTSTSDALRGDDKQPSRDQDHRPTQIMHLGPPAIRGDRKVNVTPDALDMGSKGSAEYRIRQRERERRRRQQPEQAAVEKDHSPSDTHARGAPAASARREAATACGWCGGPITLRSRGPIPKWCSATCRHRAWEQSRAAAAGRSAVEIIERVVTVAAPPPAAQPTPRQLAWVDLLRELAAQVEHGVVYDRHLAAIAAALDDVMRAVRRSAAANPRSWSRWPRGDIGVTYGARGLSKSPQPGCH